MVRRHMLYIFLALITGLFFCSTMPVMAKSDIDSGTLKTSKKSSSRTSTSTKSKKKEKSTKKSSKSRSESSAKKKTSSKKTTKKSTKGLVKVNINRATADELTAITGIGPKTAQKIVAYRKKHGAFKNADELLNVKGIGEKTLKKMKAQLKF